MIYYQYTFGRNADHATFFAELEKIGIEFIGPFIDNIWGGFSASPDLLDSLKASPVTDFASYDEQINSPKHQGIKTPMSEALRDAAYDLYLCYKERAKKQDSGVPFTATEDAKLAWTQEALEFAMSQD